MVGDMLSTLISNVASELAFSVGNWVLGQFWRVLKLETIQTIITTRDWMFGEISKTYSYN